MRLTGSFYVGRPIREPGRLEFHGDHGSLALSSFQDSDAVIERGPVGGAFEPAPYVREPYHGIDWGRGLADFARSITGAGPQRVTGEHAAHVVDVLSAARRSMRERRRIELDSTFEPPPLMDWAIGAPRP
jgi:predicted dehydrogenase